MWEKGYCGEITTQEIKSGVQEMTIILLILQLLPAQESFTYETNDKGKIGTMDVEVQKDSLGYHVVYTWEDRILELIFDTLDMSTVYVKKIVGDKIELEIKREQKLNVFFKGRRFSYKLDKPIYDRHAIEYALRDFEYTNGAKREIKFHVPELMVINAEINVLGEEVINSPLGDIVCWKVEMVPKVLFIKWRFYFWIEQSYPKRFIKYTDSSGKNSILLIDYVLQDSPRNIE